MLEEENKTVAAALAEHINIIIVRYANQHTVSQIKDEIEGSPKDKDLPFMHSNTLGGSKLSQLDFTSASKSNKTNPLKK